MSDSHTHRAEDEEFLDELRKVTARVDPVPAHVLDAARQTLVWRTIDEELAQLAYDSLLDEQPLAGVRGGSGSRMLTFEAEGITVEVEVTEVASRRTLIGQLVPPQPAEITADHGGAAAVAQADELGRFTLDDVGAGPVRLRVRRDGQPVVHTEWINL